jgi:cation:H+ antiporter
VLVAVALIASGALLLTIGAEAFAEHVVAAARVVRLSAFGLALLVAGAEPEEAWTAAVAAHRGRPDLAAGDVIGANLVVATITVGLVGLLVPFLVTRTVGWYAAIAALTAAGALLVISDDDVTRLEGTGLIGAYLVVVGLLWWRERTPPLIGELAELEEHGGDPPSLVALAWVVGGLAVMVVGGLVAVEGAQRFVAASGLSDSTVGLTVLALATSAEMLALVWSAHRRGIGEVALAGALGAVAYNATVSLGVAAVVRPLQLGTGGPLRAVGGVVVAAMAVVVAASGRRIGRLVGAALLIAYMASVSLLLR